MERRIIYTDKAPKPIGPYSQGLMVGQTLYVSGQIAHEASLEQNIEKETRQVMAHLGAILEAANLSFRHVVKCGIFLTSMDDFAVVNAVYGEFFKENPPTRETVEVKRLPKDVHVEISLVAAL